MNPEQNPSPDPLDQILQALTVTAPPPGMEQRILSAIERRAFEPARQQHRNWIRSVPLKPAFLLAFPFAVAAVLLAFLHKPLPIRHPDAPPRQEQAAGFNLPSLGIDAETDRKMDRMPRPVLSLTPLPLPPSRPAAKRDTPPPPFLFVSHSATPPQTSAARVGSVSFPAPPMPLTQQEKLLLRIAHRDDPQALAALTPEQFAADQAQDNLAFHDFFPPPTPVAYPTLISQANPPTQNPALTHGAPK